MWWRSEAGRCPRGGWLATLVAAIVMLAGLSASGQRRVTPVTPLEPGVSAPKPKAEEFDKSRLAERLDADGNVLLVDTVTGKEYVDSTLLKAPPKMEFPLLHEVVAGLNIWDPAMRAFGQKYGLADVWAELSMHNRYFPFIAAGLGNCDDAPSDQNFRFKTPLSPYFKIGASYNFLYNSNPDYRLQMGLRYGFTSYKWSLEDVTVDEGYWNEPSHFALTDQKSTAGYLEVTLGIKVKIVKGFSMGWTIVYHSILHETKNPYGQPMYIPGYGKRNGSITGNFSLMYTIPLNKKRGQEVE